MLLPLEFYQDFSRFASFGTAEDRNMLLPGRFYGSGEALVPMGSAAPRLDKL